MPSYGFGPQAASDWERANASAYGSKQQSRLAHRDSLTLVVNDRGRFEIDPRLLKSFLFE